MKIVASITDQETNAQVKSLGVDFLELRVDLFKKREAAYVLAQVSKRRMLGLPLIVTVRNQRQEGAAREFSDAEKWALLEQLVPVADWVDIELSSPLCAKTIALARSKRKKVIVSVHDFARMPANLESLLKKGLSTRADVVKIAACAQSSDDLLKMIDFTGRHLKQPVVTMCVGPWGPLSRVILPAAGSRWVYTFAQKPTAPGQLSAAIIKTQLKLLYPA